jgi:Flp pilus assembly protein TadG
MAIRCEEEFNPWPSFVDIFSSVILVLMLFLLVIIVNLGYYAQFKYKVSYTGSVTTEDIILQDISKKVILDEDKKVEDPNQDHLVPKELMTPKTEMEMMKKIEQQQKIIQQMQQQMQQVQAATDVESAGEDIADKKKKDEKSKQKITQSDKVFYITYNGNELFIDQGVSEKLKAFMAKAKQDNPNAIVNIYGTDPLDQISLTVTKQVTLGRAISVRNLIRKFQFERHQIKVKLADKPSIPRDIKIDTGVIVVEVTD